MNIPWPAPHVVNGVPIDSILKAAFEVVQRSECATAADYADWLKGKPTRSLHGRSLPWRDPEFIRRAFVLKDAVDAGDEARVAFLVEERDGRNF